MLLMSVSATGRFLGTQFLDKMHLRVIPYTQTEHKREQLDGIIRQS